MTASPAKPGARTVPAFKAPADEAAWTAAYDGLLKAWPVAFESRSVPTRFGPTHVIASGPPDAPALVLLHSLAATAAVWRPNAAALSARFRVYAVDVIGQPGKTRAHRRLRSRRDYAAWLADVLDGLGVTRAHLVGCSFGGFLAISQASLSPERVDRLVLISPAGTFVRLSMRFVALMLTSALRRRLRRLLRDRRQPGLADLGALRAPLHPDDDAWRALMGKTMALSPTLSTINAAVLSRAELHGIRAPTLLLIGDLERLYDPVSTLAVARARMPQIRTALVPGADHIAAMAQPEAVNARILAFLEGDPS